MTLVKTSIFNAIAVAVKVASALALNKLLAIYIGPAGYAIIGQFQNVVSILVSIAGGLFSTGVTKETAQHNNDSNRQHAVWQTAIRFSLIASLIIGCSLLLVADEMAKWLLHRKEMSSVFIWLAFALPGMALNNLSLAIVNGKKEVSIYVVANIVGSLLSLSLIGLLAHYFGLYGALVAFTINPAIILLSTAAMVVRRDWFKAKFLWGKINSSVLYDLSGFGLMGLTSALSVPITSMLIRDYLTLKLGLTDAGYWQAIWKISEIYLMMVTTTLSLYYLPRLAEIRNSLELKSEIFKVYRFVMPVVVVSALIIYLLRDFIIGILFTPEFLPMRELFSWQLIGDVIKIGSWVLAYIMLGRGMVKVFIITEIAFSMSFVMLSWFLVVDFGLIGVSIAYGVNYFFYWIGMAVLIRMEMQRMGKIIP